MSFPRQLGNRFRSIVVIVTNAVSFIASIITIAVVFAATILTFIAKFTSQQQFIIPLFAFILGVIVSFIILASVNIIHLRSIPVRWILRGYRWVSAEYIYCIEDDNLLRHFQTIKIVLKATRSGVNIFENKYSWSGHGKQELLEVKSKGHELMGSLTKKQFYYQHSKWKYYYIYLGHELQLSEKAEIEIKQTLFDDDGRFEPYVSKIVTEPVEGLKLRALIPESCHYINAYTNELSHGGPNSQRIDSKIANSKIIRDNNTNKLYTELYYEIPNPHLNHKYEIRWEW